LNFGVGFTVSPFQDNERFAEFAASVVSVNMDKTMLVIKIGRTDFIRAFTQIGSASQTINLHHQNCKMHRRVRELTAKFPLPY
jgi:ribosomal protein S17